MISNLLQLFLLLFYVNSGLTADKYDPGELVAKIFNVNFTLEPRQSGYGLVKFEGQSDTDDSREYNHGYVKFEGENTKPFKFETDSHFDQDNGAYGLVNFQNDNSVETPAHHQEPNRKKKRRRRRKPKQQHYPPLLPGPVNDQTYPIPNTGLQGFPQRQNPYFSPGYIAPPYYGPVRRPRVSITSQALSYITEALTSVATYDDYQCVPRILCEAAGGAQGSSSWLENIAGIQPLLTLLSAYNGISSSPLFVFGRAVFLGMTSKTNPGTCRYAYPLCPTDPEKLVQYLNNHNGGFFKFFSAPQGHNLEEFYHQLTMNGQNFGLHQNPNEVDQQNYGLYQNQQGPDYVQHHSGFPNNHNQESYGFQNSNLYSNGYGYLQNYGVQYPYNDNSLNRIRFKAEKRIQNKPDNKYVFVDNDIENSQYSTKWSFPTENKIENFIADGNRVGKILTFPENIKKLSPNNKGSSSFFPGAHTNRKYVEYYNYPPLIPISNNNNLQYYNNYATDAATNPHSTNNNYNNNLYSGTYNNSKDDDVRIVYVVRGNGDPNNPEIVKLRPGETLH